jgi:serine/threonine-protein phosphatase 2B regulatory subunit
MGNGVSGLDRESIDALLKASGFSEGELKKLYRRFKLLDKDGSGTLTTNEFMSIPDLALNPLLERILQIFDKNKDDEIQFSEFISVLSTLSDKGTKEDKLRFAFQVYDIDADGYISNGELFRVLKMMVGTNLTDIQLQQIVDKSMIEGDLDGDGKISFEEFVKMIGTSEGIDEKLTITWE